MIYITGDTHASFERRFSTNNFPEQKNMTKDDYLIICGDFGGIWDIGEESKSEKWWLDWFEERNYTLLFVDGNHENFDRLYDYPVREWHGGKVHEIRPHVLHLMRGQVFEINGKKIFTFGGASSNDIILELEDPNFESLVKRMNKENKMYRVNHISWWELEIASDEEFGEGISNLKTHNYNVDYIVTHCCSSSTQDMLGLEKIYGQDILTAYLDFIKESTNYGAWYFGHYHDSMQINEKETMLYEQIIRIV